MSWALFQHALPIAMTAAQSVIGAQEKRKDRKQADQIHGQQMAKQEEFAKNGIRWKVEDARRAGIHPLAALGASGASYSPVGYDSGGPDTSKSDFAASMGQNITRAISSTRTGEEKEMASLQLANARANLDGQVIDNQIRLSQLRQMNNTGSPNFPGSDNFVPGQGNSGLVKEKPLERTVSAPGRPAQEAGWRPDVAYSRTDTGLTPVVPESLSESLEDDLVGKLMWRMRNQLVPNFTGRGAPAKSQLPKGADNWEWSHSSQEWQPIKGRSWRDKADSGRSMKHW